MITVEHDECSEGENLVLNRFINVVSFCRNQKNRMEVEGPHVTCSSSYICFESLTFVSNQFQKSIELNASKAGNSWRFYSLKPHKILKMWTLGTSTNSPSLLSLGDTSDSRGSTSGGGVSVSVDSTGVSLGLVCWLLGICSSGGVVAAISSGGGVCISGSAVEGGRSLVLLSESRGSGAEVTGVGLAWETKLVSFTAIWKELTVPNFLRTSTLQQSLLCKIFTFPINWRGFLVFFLVPKICSYSSVHSISLLLGFLTRLCAEKTGYNV